MSNICLNCGKDISHKPKNKYCNNSCQGLYERKKKYEYFLTEPDEYQNAKFSIKWIKPIILEEQNNKCDICGIENIWNGSDLVFILDHIDGNAANNTRKNYRLVCPNCDSQLDTFKSKNKNSARTYRYE